MLFILPMRAGLPLLAFLFLAIPVVPAIANESIPFDLVDGYILVHARIDSRPVTMLVDSGASISVLGQNSAHRLGIAMGGAQQVDGVDAGATAYQIKPAVATASGIPMASIGLVLDLSNAAQLCSKPVDGLIGADFFRGKVVKVDYANHRLHLTSSAPQTAGDWLPLRQRNGVFCVQVSVNGSHPRWTRLDTGCNDGLHWVVPRMADTQQHRGATVGFITNTQDETLVSVRLGKITLPQVETALHGHAIFPGEAGLLGSGVLSNYTVTIDGIQNRIQLAPAK